MKHNLRSDELRQGLLQGKTAIVTGAGSGLGKAIAQLFLQQGANVIFVDLNQEALAQAVEPCRTEQVRAIKTDVSCEDQVEVMVKEALETFNRLDIVVNCAGIPQTMSPLEDISTEQWDRIINVNVKSIFLMSKYTVPIMKKQEKGSIINIASIAGEKARPNLSAYCTSKGAAIMLTKSMAIELAPFRIRVNAINPAAVETPLLNQLLNGDETQKEEDKKKLFLDNIPLGSLIQPEDIAQAAIYLASDNARMVTGEILNVDGGRGI